MDSTPFFPPLCGFCHVVVVYVIVVVLLVVVHNRMPVDVEMQLLAYANVTLGLNPASLPYVRTLQAGCPDPE